MNIKEAANELTVLIRDRFKNKNLDRSWLYQTIECFLRQNCLMAVAIESEVDDTATTRGVNLNKKERGEIAYALLSDDEIWGEYDRQMHCLIEQARKGGRQ